MAENSSVVDYIKINIIPMRGIKEITSWEDKINDIYGSLYGYQEDVRKIGIKEVLYNILSTKFKSSETGEEFTNFSTLSSVYIFYLEGIKPDYKEENKSIIDSLNDEINKLQSLTKDSCDVILKYGIVDIIELVIPYNKINKDSALIMGEDVYIASDKRSLFNKNREEIEMDIDYYPTFSRTTFSNLNLTAKVCIFSKMKKKLFDVTKFLNYINTSVTETGGNFVLKMNFVSESNIENREAYTNENINETGYSKALFLQSLFRDNDLVFIKFETLKLEENKKDSKEKEISGKVWDMIGLIDSVAIQSDAASIEINILGRDLIKLLIDDNNLFIPYMFASSQKTAFGGNSSEVFKRLFATGEYQTTFVRNLRSISNTLGFIFSQLTNIQILTDNCYQWLVNEYGDKLGKKFIYNQSGKIESKENIKGIWGLVDFMVDEKINHYRVCDASFALPDGSVLNQIEKICQKPLVEFLCDTFGDKYTIVARRPPWDEEDIKNSLAISIDPVLSLSDNLSMDDEIYSLFQYSPQGALLGGNQNIALAYLPIVVLDEYVKIWGNRIYSFVSNYIDYNTYTKSLTSGAKSPKYVFIDDLIWLIKVMAYKPFTRKGTITIRGDRRIKRGMWIWYKKTNEIFYVDSVANSAQIQGNGDVDRFTTLNVSRGMIKDFIDSSKEYVEKGNSSENAGFYDYTKKKDSKYIYKSKTYSPSYFNLIAVEYLRESLINNLIEVDKAYSLERFVGNKGETDYKGTESVVVKGVFDFFMKGSQFITSNDFNQSDEDSKEKSPALRVKNIIENNNKPRAWVKRNRKY